MKIKLTKRWKRRPHSESSDAMCGYIHLKCDFRIVGNKNQGVNLTKKDLQWAGSASLVQHTRFGPIQKSIKAAQQDAQRLAVELLQDIRDGTKILMDYYEMGEDD
jgi:hypothetical protein